MTFVVLITNGCCTVNDHIRQWFVSVPSHPGRVVEGVIESYQGAFSFSRHCLLTCRCCCFLCFCPLLPLTRAPHISPCPCSTPCNKLQMARSKHPSSHRQHWAMANVTDNHDGILLWDTGDIGLLLQAKAWGMKREREQMTEQIGDFSKAFCPPSAITLVQLRLPCWVRCVCTCQHTSVQTSFSLMHTCCVTRGDLYVGWGGVYVSLCVRVQRYGRTDTIVLFWITGEIHYKIDCKLYYYNYIL